MNSKGMEFHVRSQLPGHCGDNICLLSAAIEFAEKVDGIVYVDIFKDVVEAYQHPRLRFGDRGIVLNTSAPYKHRNKHPGLFVNLLGTYYSELGLPIVDPVLRLPKFDKCEPQVLIQTESVYAANPPVRYVQGIVDEFVKLTGLMPQVIGNLATRKNLRNVEYGLLRDSVPFFMQQVQNAVCVLTPRSFAANLAAGYAVPAFMWSPDDGEDWHLDYRSWRGTKVNFGKVPDVTLDSLRRFVDDFGLRRKLPDPSGW